MEPSDLATIRAALERLPSRCRYHGDDTAPPPGLIRREACCDTGIPTQRRKNALAALERVEKGATV
ncbi:hypothetical protein [Streptomyces sp. NPDC047042]|uniref:hypothetical protein n=1 Tax=Streptomyces sp. NPDC047042 TaxID=3154807 RepID=UPI00340ABA6A